MTKILTVGTFDVFHYGHLRLLEDAKKLGETLIVGVASDSLVHAFKGYGRPIYPLEQRMAILAALRCVDIVLEFTGKTKDDNTKALASLARRTRPDIFAEGEGKDEMPEFLKEIGTRRVLIPRTPKMSTSKTIARFALSRAMMSEEELDDFL